MAWAELEAGTERGDGETGSMETRGGAAQYLGRDTPCCILEIRCAKDFGRRETWFVCVEGEQFFCATGNRAGDRRGLESGQGNLGKRTRATTSGGAENCGAPRRGKGGEADLWRGVSRYLSRGADSVAETSLPGMRCRSVAQAC